MFGVQKETAGRELLALTGGVAELRLLLTRVEAKMDPQDGAITALRQTSQDTAKRFDQTLDKLKKTSIIGRNFIGI